MIEKFYFHTSGSGFWHGIELQLRIDFNKNWMLKSKPGVKRLLYPYEGIFLVEVNSYEGVAFTSGCTANGYHAA